MTGRRWIPLVIVVATASVFFLRSATSHTAASTPDLSQDALTAARFGLTAARFDVAAIRSFDTEGIEVNVANERLANETVGDAFCRFAVTFYDARGLVLYTTELRVGPGEIGRVDLPARQLQGELLFRTTIQVLDTDSGGRIRPCPALPSARVYDRLVGNTKYYVPVTIQ